MPYKQEPPEIFLADAPFIAINDRSQKEFCHLFKVRQKGERR